MYVVQKLIYHERTEDCNLINVFGFFGHFLLLQFKLSLSLWGREAQMSLNAAVKAKKCYRKLKRRLDCVIF